MLANTPVRVSEDMPDRMPEDIMPDSWPEGIPEDMLVKYDRMPEDMENRMPEDLPEREVRRYTR